MGANPMQKMKRNAILIGLIIGLMIGLILCVCMYMFLGSEKGETEQSGEPILVSVLNRDIKSGEVITPADISSKTMNKLDVPVNAVSVTTNVVAKIDLGTGTILTDGMLSGEQTTSLDLREQEYNMITLPTQLAKGDFIDIRLQLPNGGDYIVIAKKQVLDCNNDTVWLKMTEEEILTMSNAIIEYYIMAGSKLYATKYTDAGLQTAAKPTYCPNSDVESLIRAYKNVGDSKIFSDTLIKMRNDNINPAVNQYRDSAIANIEQNIQEEIKNLKESRETYFGALNSAY